MSKQSTSTTDMLWLLAGIGALAFAFSLSYVKVDDYDVWWHLKCGEMFVENGTVLKKEIFSYTANGRPWVNGYLPAQVVMYLCYKIGGVAGVSLFGTFFTTAIFAVALAMTRRSKFQFAVGAMVLLPAALMSRAVILPRPALFTPLLALVAIWLVDDYLKRGGKRVFLLAPLTMLWANFHPGFPLAMMLTGVFGAALLAEQYLKRTPAPGYPHPSANIKTLALIGLAQCVAALINPNHVMAYYSIIELGRNIQLTSRILEWRSMFMPPPEPALIRETFVALCGVWAATALISWRRLKLSNALVFLFVAASTISGRRNLLLFGAIIIPLIAWNLDDIEPGSLERFARLSWERISPALAVATFVAGICLSWYALTNRLYFDSSVVLRTGLGIQEAVFPLKAIEILKKENIKGNLFHPYALGGYLIWELFPKYKVFIDGRIYPYPIDIFDKEEKAFTSAEAFDELRPRYDIRVVVLPLIPESNWPVAWGFVQSPLWATVQADGASVMFMLRNAGNDDIIARYEIDLLKTAPALETRSPDRKYGVFSMAEYPFGQIRWGKIYEKIGRPDLAAMAVESALNYKPMVDHIDTWYALLLMEVGRVDEGYPFIERRLAKAPNDISALIGLGDYQVAKKKLDDAEKTYLRISELDPGMGNVWNTLGEIAFNRRDYRVAMERFRKAVALVGDDGKYWENLGMSLESLDATEAHKALTKALELYETEAPGGTDSIRVRAELEKFKPSTP